MWHWDQGHLAYFQFDALRRIASFVGSHDVMAAERPSLLESTGLEFPAPPTHSAWRNYSRALKLALLVSEFGNAAEPTEVAALLAGPGGVTCDEYMHFLARAFTDPSPALAGWRRNARFRYPLLFAIKYLLAKCSIGAQPAATSLDEIVGAYHRSRFDGGEDEGQFVNVVTATRRNVAASRNVPAAVRRQARESIKVIAQISYLHMRRSRIVVSLNAEDSRQLFRDLAPVVGPRARDSDSEIRRLASLFPDGVTDLEFDYTRSTLDDVRESGFFEGSKVKRTHIVVERNSGLRRDFFRMYPDAICDVCRLDTHKSYPWTKRVLDLHHLLPLCSGTQVDGRNTIITDLVPVCPSCHCAVHRFYDKWLADKSRADFMNSDESRGVYGEMKATFRRAVHAPA